MRNFLASLLMKSMFFYVRKTGVSDTYHSTGSMGRTVYLPAFTYMGLEFAQIDDY